MFWLLTQPYYLAFINHGSEMIMQVKIQNLFFLTRPRTLTQDFAGGSEGKNPLAKCRRHGFDP